MFITGIIKYGERVFLLWSSSIERFKDNWLSDHHPIPYFAQITRETLNEHKNEQGKGKCQLLEVVFLFNIFARLFAGNIFNIRTVKDRILEGKSAENAFNVVAMELGLMYDLLYTKATIIYSRFGAFLRCISLFCSVSTLAFFSVFVNLHAYSQIEISITYILLVGAVVLEVYAIILHFFSDWTKLICLIKTKNSRPNCFNTTISPHSLLHNQKRWSESMGQFNLISFCLKDMSAACIKVEKLFRISIFLGKYWYLTWAHVDLDMKEMILNYILNKAHQQDDFLFKGASSDIFQPGLEPSIPVYEVALAAGAEKTFRLSAPVHEIAVAARGDNVLNRSERLKDFLWTIHNVEFDHSLIIWHIATDISYYNDFGRGELKFRETSEKAKSIFKSKRNMFCNDNGKIRACQVLLQEDVHHIDEVNADLSALLDGCKLGKALQKLEYKEKWDVIRQVWVEMLTFAAARCEWKEHGKRLKKGGELPTHVSLLLAHFGLVATYLIAIDNNGEEDKGTEKGSTAV
ncbi:uncharacterized protein LOC116105441 [Pistacia vera]|uniref:uncharacterized protein LOC116105441 n=1 Tax=Pistacia vera TaxID=55513 RepID=UPI001263CD87|nr:uncharacterized protein LOC116105441 [Pistacia vera]